MNRRDLLTASAAAPLAGLGLGAPAEALAAPAGFSAVDSVPMTLALLEGYSEWLFYERRLLAMELYPGVDEPERLVPMTGTSSGWHFQNRFPAETWRDLRQPSTRAATVLVAAGVIDGERRSRRPEAAERSADEELASYIEFLIVERARACAEYRRRRIPSSEAPVDIFRTMRRLDGFAPSLRAPRVLKALDL